MEQIDKAKLLEWLKAKDYPNIRIETLIEEIEFGTFNIKEPKQQFSVERDSWGHAQTIKEGNRVVLWLLAGAERNEEEADRIVALLNKNPIQGEKTE